MIRTTLIVAALVLVLPVSAMGQEKEIKASYEDFLEWGNRLEGRWVGKIKLIADWPGLGKKQGDEVIGHVTYKWIVDKRAIEETSLIAEGEAKCLHFWDAGSKQIKIVCVTAGGGTWTACLGRDGDKWPWRLKGYLKDGTKNEGSGVDILKADGSFIVDGDCTLDGEKLLHLHDVYKKVSK